MGCSLWPVRQRRSNEWINLVPLVGLALEQMVHNVWVISCSPVNAILCNLTNIFTPLQQCISTTCTISGKTEQIHVIGAAIWSPW